MTKRNPDRLRGRDKARALRDARRLKYRPSSLAAFGLEGE